MEQLSALREAATEDFRFDDCRHTAITRNRPGYPQQKQRLPVTLRLSGSRVTSMSTSKRREEQQPDSLNILARQIVKPF